MRVYFLCLKKGVISVDVKITRNGNNKLIARNQKSKLGSFILHLWEEQETSNC